MKKILFTIVFFAISFSLFAVPAKRGQWRIITLENGTEIRVELRGDEHVSFFQSEDGRVFQPVIGQKYCRQVERAQIAEKAQKARMNNALLSANGNPKNLNLGGDHQPYFGSKKCLCILVQFTDVQFKEENTVDVFKDLINKVDYENYALGHVGSVRDYFLDQSNGDFDIQFDVVGPFTLAHNQAYYGEHDSYGNNDRRPTTMVKEAIAQSDGYVNFADYDWDGDGYVEPIFVLYAGMGEADGGGDDTIWPHKSSITRERHDGVYVRDYACGSELNGNGIIDGIGTMCHEYSHCLGLPETYDTSYSGVYGTDMWDIMNAGCYNGGGNIPAGYTAYERWYAGWLEPYELTEDASITRMQPLTSGGEAFIIRNDDRPNEYYLFENRAKESWDAGLPGEGLLIYHVDFDATAWAYNIVNTITPGWTDHPRLQIVPADNSFGASYANVGGDAFPNGGNNCFMDVTEPAAEWFYPNSKGEFYVGKPIRNIVFDADKFISFDFSNQLSTPEKPEGAYFYESFSYCEGEGGNDGAFTSASKVRFIPDNRGWAAENAFSASSCAFFGTNIKKGNVTTPKFDVPEGQNAVLSFRAVPFGTEARSLTLSVASGTATLETTTVSLTSKQWQDYTVNISGGGKMSLNFTSNSRRFFLDEVLVMPETTGITEITTTPSNGKVYNLSGQQVSPATRGLLIRDGKKYVNK